MKRTSHPSRTDVRRSTLDGHDYSSRMTPGYCLGKGLPPCVSGLASGN